MNILNIIKEELENILDETLYHGSPHDFEEFLLDKIGTGEGAQAFGWGLYFTELEDIAFRYSRINNNILYIADYLYGINYKTKDVEKLESMRNSKIIELINNKFDEDYLKLKERFKNKPEKRDYFNYLLNINITARDKFISDINSTNPTKYKISLKKDINNYNWLEWYKEISENLKMILYKTFSEKSLNGEIHNIEISERFDADTYDGGKTYKVADTTKIYNDDEFIDKTYNNLNDAELEARRLNFLDTYIEGCYFYEALAKEMSPKGASLFLLKHGIDGIKFPAESIARGITSETARGFNYVIFDPSIIKIEEKTKY